MLNDVGDAIAVPEQSIDWVSSWTAYRAMLWVDRASGHRGIGSGEASELKTGVLEPQA